MSDTKNRKNIEAVQKQRNTINKNNHSVKDHINPESVKKLLILRGHGHKFVIKPWADPDVSSFIHLNLAKITKVGNGYYKAKLTKQGRRALKKIIFPDHRLINTCRRLSGIFTVVYAADMINIAIGGTKIALSQQLSSNFTLGMAISGAVLIISLLIAVALHKAAKIYKSNDIAALDQKTFIARSIENKLWMHLRYQPSAESFLTIFRH